MTVGQLRKRIAVSLKVGALTDDSLVHFLDMDDDGEAGYASYCENDVFDTTTGDPDSEGDVAIPVLSIIKWRTRKGLRLPDPPSEE